jgi:hypothetical protein
MSFWSEAGPTIGAFVGAAGAAAAGWIAASKAGDTEALRLKDQRERELAARRDLCYARLLDVRLRDQLWAFTTKPQLDESIEQVPRAPVAKQVRVISEFVPVASQAMIEANTAFAKQLVEFNLALEKVNAEELVNGAADPGSWRALDQARMAVGETALRSSDASREGHPGSPFHGRSIGRGERCRSRRRAPRVWPPWPGACHASGLPAMFAPPGPS